MAAQAIAERPAKILPPSLPCGGAVKGWDHRAGGPAGQTPCTTARLLGNSSLAAVADFTAAPGLIEVRLSSEGSSIVQVPDSRAAPERCPLVLSSENPTAAERISAASTTARLLGNSSLVAVAAASAAPARVEAGLSCENSSSTQSIQPTEAVPSAARVWAMTLRCKYLHCLDIKAGALHDVGFLCSEVETRLSGCRKWQHRAMRTVRHSAAHPH